MKYQSKNVRRTNGFGCKGKRSLRKCRLLHIKVKCVEMMRLFCRMFLDFSFSISRSIRQHERWQRWHCFSFRFFFFVDKLREVEIIYQTRSVLNAHVSIGCRYDDIFTFLIDSPTGVSVCQVDCMVGWVGLVRESIACVSRCMKSNTQMP